MTLYMRAKAEAIFTLIFVAAAVFVVQKHRLETMQQIGCNVAFALV